MGVGKVQQAGQEESGCSVKWKGDIVNVSDVAVRDVLAQDFTIPGIPRPPGVWVLCALGEATASVVPVSSNAGGLYAIDDRYQISVEDLVAFTATGEQARISK